MPNYSGLSIRDAHVFSSILRIDEAFHDLHESKMCISLSEIIIYMFIIGFGFVFLPFMPNSKKLE